jgi:hypothetical protein
VHRVLSARGELLLSTVVRDSVDGRLYGDHWAGFDFPRHMVFFTLADITGALQPHFSVIEVFHQNQPLDFAMAASARRRGAVDRAVARAAASRLAQIPGFALALLHATSRVSLRCRA